MSDWNSITKPQLELHAKKSKDAAVALAECAKIETQGGSPQIFQNWETKVYRVENELSNFGTGSIETQTGGLWVDRLPHCPWCCERGRPRQLFGWSFGEYSFERAPADAFFLCDACSKTFIARYDSKEVSNKVGKWLYMGHLYAVEPHRPSVYHVPSDIAAMSPQFAEIAQQASDAEQYGLDQIAGVGYRKALEFLIKDYCIEVWPDKKDEIRKAWLGECIKTYVTDADVRKVSEYAIWLGNDEAHYERRWQDKDIRDLKQLIRLTIVWIGNHRRTRQYEAEMSQ